jgi:hypothetical protein
MRGWLAMLPLLGFLTILALPAHATQRSRADVTQRLLGVAREHRRSLEADLPRREREVRETAASLDRNSILYARGVITRMELSVDLEQFDIDTAGGASSLTVTFKASSGATHTSSSVGTIDFTALSGWSNITDFTMEVPLNDVTCVTGLTDCSGFRFDNIALGPATVEEPGPSTPGVPEPTTLGLLTLGLIGLAARRYRKAA